MALQENELNVMLCVPGLSRSPSRERRFSNLMSRLGLRVRASPGHRIAQILNIYQWRRNHGAPGAGASLYNYYVSMC